MKDFDMVSCCSAHTWHKPGNYLQPSLTLARTRAGSNLRLIDVPISNCIRSGINKVRFHPHLAMLPTTSTGTTYAAEEGEPWWASYSGSRVCDRSCSC